MENSFHDKKNRFDKYDALLLFGIAIIAMQLMGISVLFIPSEYEFVSIIVTQLTMFFTVFLYSKARKIQFIKATSANKSIKWYLYPLLVALALSMLSFMLTVDTWFINILEKIGISIFEGQVNYGDTPFIKICVLLTFSLAPAIGEEFLMRGGIANGLINSTGRNKGIVLSALLFAIMHTNPGQLLHPFIIGIVMACLLYLTGSIWSAVIVHFVNNFTVVAIELWFAEGFLAVYEKYQTWFVVIGFVVAIIVAYLIIYLSKKQRTRENADKNTSSIGQGVEENQVDTLLMIKRKVADSSRRTGAIVIFVIALGISILTFTMVAMGLVS